LEDKEVISNKLVNLLLAMNAAYKTPQLWLKKNGASVSMTVNKSAGYSVKKLFYKLVSNSTKLLDVLVWLTKAKIFSSPTTVMTD